MLRVYWTIQAVDSMNCQKAGQGDGIMDIRKFSLRILAAPAILLMSWGVQAQVADPLSPHNLSTFGPGAGSTTSQVCVYCHTPHAGAGALAGNTVPLWNKAAVSVEGDFDRYSDLGSVTFDAAEANVGSVSMACLTCHDGVQAIDVAINASGRDLGPGFIDTGARTMPGLNTIAVLGTDLRDDHPISMQYAAGGLTDATVPPLGSPPALQPGLGVFGDPDFEDPWAMTLNATPIWWLDVADGANNPGIRDKSDVLLYTRNDLGAVEPFVECGSCHDPHNYDSFLAGDSVAFLRVRNDSSQICTACHDK